MSTSSRTSIRASHSRRFLGARRQHRDVVHRPAKTVPRAPLIAEGEPSLDQLRTPDCCGRDAEIGVSGFAVQLLTELKTTNRRSGPLSTTVDSTELSTVAAKRLTSVSRPVPSGSW